MEGRARLVLDYNTPANNPELIKWLQSVYKAHLKPYITIRECEPQEGFATKCPSHPPTIKEYQKAVERLMKAFRQENEKEKLPAVTVWGAWNEPDGAKNPFHHHPKQAALFWKVAQHAASSIFQKSRRYTVVAGEFEQYYPGYTKTYREAILGDHAFWAGKPHVWGLHDYQDLLRSGELGRYVTEDAKEFLGLGSKSLGHPHMWISEAGVELQNGEEQTPLAGEGEAELKRQRVAANDFLQLAKVAREIHGERPSEHVYQHIEWLYYYLYRSPTKAQRLKHYFDSALLEIEPAKPEYEEREAYCILALGKPACPARVGTGAPVAGATTSSASTVLLTVDPRGLLTKYFVTYGTSTAYGHVTSSGTITNDVGTQSETVGLSSVEPCRTYHYQAEAESSANEGTPSLGGDKTFETGGCEATAVSAGEFHACALLTSDGVDCWGSDYVGELGNGTTTPDSSIPVEVSGLSNATAVVAGGNDSCALLSTGHIDCWGENDYGQLGDSTTVNSSTPVAVSGITNGVAITTGGYASCVALSNGHVDCWGENAAGELGNGTKTNSSSPVEVSGITNATAVTASDRHACALLSTGHLDCWGTNEWGELGNGTKTGSSTPVAAGEIANAVAVSTSRYDTCALLSSGDVDCWGESLFGQLGDGKAEESLIPVAVSGITNATVLSTGGEHACVLRSSGSIDCWGRNQKGQLGDGTSTGPETCLFSFCSKTPVAVSEITYPTTVSADWNYTCVLLSEGDIDCWGENYNGQLGNGTTEDSSTPVRVSGIG